MRGSDEEMGMIAYECSEAYPPGRWSCEWFPYSRQFTRPLNTVYGAWTRRTGLLIRLRSIDARICGLGEVAPIPWFATETLEDATSVLKHLSGTHLSATDLLRLAKGLPALTSGISSALLDAKGLGDPAVTSSDCVSVCKLFSSIDAIVQAIGNGCFRSGTCKAKIAHGRIADDAKHLRELLRILPSEVSIRLDANGGLGRADAEMLMAIAAGQGRVVFEQPLPPGSEADSAAIAQDFGVQLALDESVAGLASLERLAFRFPKLLFVVKSHLLGDWFEFLKWRRIHPEIRLIHSSVFETAIGSRNALWMALGEPNPPAAGFGIGAWLPKDGLGGFPESSELRWADFAHLPTRQRLLNEAKFSPDRLQS